MPPNPKTKLNSESNKSLEEIIKEYKWKFESRKGPIAPEEFIDVITQAYEEGEKKGREEGHKLTAKEVLGAELYTSVRQSVLDEVIKEVEGMKQFN